MFDSLKKKFSFLKWIDPFTYVDLWVMPKLNPNNNSTLAWIIYIVFAAVFAFLIYNGIGLLLGTPFPFVIVLTGSMEPNYYRGDIIVLHGADTAKLNAPVIELNYPSLKNVSPSKYLKTYCSAKDSTELVPCTEFVLKLFQKQITAEDFSTKELLFSTGETIKISQKGAIAVYFSEEQQRQIIHRIVAVLKAQDGYYVLTKGDSEKNPLVDQDKYIINNTYVLGGITSYAKHVNELQGQAAFKIPLLGYVKLILIDDPMQLLLGCPYDEGCIFP